MHTKNALLYGLWCALLGAGAAWLGLQLFPTSAGFVAAASARHLIIGVAAGVLLALGVLWLQTGERKTAILEATLLCMLAVPLTSLLALHLWWGAGAATWHVGWVLGFDLLKRTVFLMPLMGLALQQLKGLARWPHRAPVHPAESRE